MNNELNYRANLGKQSQEVSRMFDSTAKNYDLVNDILSLGIVRYWRKCALRAVPLDFNSHVLDVAAGTGTSSIAYFKQGYQVTACDISEGMLNIASEKYPMIEFCRDDATVLNFPDNTFDLVTISFGLRNVENVDLALKQMLRVTKPGGALVILEFSHPTSWLLQTSYRFYLKVMPALVAKVFSSNAPSYEYLTETIEQWSNQVELAKIIHASGWNKVQYKNLTHGIACVHRAYKL